MKHRREPLSPTARFDILKRDDFTCMYCGASAPDVKLHVDHVVPIFHGGKNDKNNLVTACSVCNSGKGRKRLDVLVSRSRTESGISEYDVVNEELSLNSGKRFFEPSKSVIRIWFKEYLLYEVLWAINEAGAFLWVYGDEEPPEYFFEDMIEVIPLFLAINRKTQIDTMESRKEALQ